LSFHKTGIWLNAAFGLPRCRDREVWTEFPATQPFDLRLAAENHERWAAFCPGFSGNREDTIFFWISTGRDAMKLCSGLDRKRDLHLRHRFWIVAAGSTAVSNFVSSNERKAYLY